MSAPSAPGPTLFQHASSKPAHKNKALPTPVVVDRLAFWLRGYDEDKAQFLIDGFSKGFRVGFQGSCNNTVPPNLKSAHEMPDVVTEHIQKELHAGRIAGPFKIPPFKHFQCSPIGLVEKKREREI